MKTNYQFAKEREVRLSEDLTEKDAVVEVYEYYNKKGIIEHKELTKKKAKRIDRALEKYSMEEIKKVIDNYSRMLNDEDYFYSYKYGVDKLVGSMNMDKFNDEGEKYINYIDSLNRRKKNKNKNEEENKFNGKEINESFDDLYQKLLAKAKQIDYEEYLNSKKWQDFRKEAIFHAGNKCQICGTAKKLNVHHNNYKNLGRETFNDVAVLCNSCHKKFHDIDG